MGHLSDNRKSAIQNRKWVRFSIIALVFVIYGARIEAQQAKKIPRIGYVSVSGSASNPGILVETFRRQLRDLGHVEGQNVLLEIRYAAENPGQAPRLIADLVQLPVDVLVLSSSDAIHAARKATKTIPIVIIASFDPVATGLVESLARPGGNITGVTRMHRELSGKRLELLKEALPLVSRVGILGAEGGESSKEYETAARPLKIPVQMLHVRREPNPDFEGVFQAAIKARVNALVVVGSSRINSFSRRINELAIQKKLPSMHQTSAWVERGGLMSYSSHDAENFRRAAFLVDKILKGSKPADLPIEQPMRFDFVVNLKTAQQIGVTIAPNVLVRADRVIR